jgi:hypothetical protein
MKNLLIAIVLILYSKSIIPSQEMPWQGPSADFSHGKLKVSENKRFLVYDDGTPFLLPE